MPNDTILISSLFQIGQLILFRRKRTKLCNRGIKTESVVLSCDRDDKVKDMVTDRIERKGVFQNLGMA